MIAPYLARLGITSGQACTLSLGIVLGGVLLAVSVPPVWDRRAQAAAAPAPAVAAPGTPAAPTAPMAGPAPIDPPAGSMEPPSAASEPLLIPPPDAPLADRPDAAQAPAAPPPPAATASTTTATPLVVVESGYSTPDPTPIAVPEDGLPIGARLGARAEASYVRLDGTATVLRLDVSQAAGASSGPDAPRVQACRISSRTWAAQRPGPPVPYDDKACAPGRAQPDGGYEFDLTRFADRTDVRGFALVAAPGTTGTFRLTLTPARSTT